MDDILTLKTIRVIKRGGKEGEKMYGGMFVYVLVVVAAAPSCVSP